MATLNVIADEIGDALNRPFDWQFKARIKLIFRHEAATMIRQSIDKDGLTDHFKTKYTAAISLVDDSTILCGNTCPSIRTTAKQANPIRYKTDDPFSFVGNAAGTVVYIYTKLTELPYANLTEVYLAEPIRYLYQNGYLYIKDESIITCSTVTAFEGATHVIDEITTNGTDFTSAAHGLEDGDTVSISFNIVTPSYILYYVDADTFFLVVDLPESTTAPGTWKLLTSDRVDCISVEGAFNMGDVLADTPENRLNSTTFTDDTELPLPEDLIQTIKLKLLQGELSITDSDDKIKAQHIDN